MDWSNERYVRLYVRDTTSWRRLGWDGQCMLMHLLRRADRSGALEIDGLEPWEAAMLQTGAPEDVARRGVEAMLRVGVVEVRGALLVFPNYLAAQECTKSDALRAREYRERRAAGNFVTNRDAIESRDVTVSSQVDRDRHEPSHGVTPCSAVQCSTVQYTEASAGSPPDAGGELPFEASPEKPSKPRDERKLLFAATWKAEAKALGFESTPDCPATQRDKAIRMATESAEATGKSFAECLRARVVGGLGDARSLGKAPKWCLVDWDPRPPPRPLVGRAGRLLRAEPAGHEEFAGADVAAQLERLGAL
jgi:hypothetical protein